MSISLYNYTPCNSTWTCLNFVSFDPILAEIKSSVNLALPKRLITQFKPEQQIRQQALRAYCSNIYTVYLTEPDRMTYRCSTFCIEWNKTDLSPRHTMSGTHKFCPRIVRHFWHQNRWILNSTVPTIWMVTFEVDLLMSILFL